VWRFGALKMRQIYHRYRSSKSIPLDFSNFKYSCWKRISAMMILLTRYVSPNGVKV
jgi:hypothetical protein